MKPPNNKHEREFFDKMSASGYSLTKRGWPDFFCVKGKEIVLVEVKPHRGRRLKKEQLAVMKALAAYGVPCYRWSPDNGLLPIDLLR